MKHSKVISNRQINFDLDNKLKKIHGRKVIAANGEVVGKVKSIIGNYNKIEGILVKRNNILTFVDYIHIQDLYSKSVMLKINPISRILGMQVFDAEGKKLGRVVDFIQVDNKNEFSEIIVKKGIFNRRLTIPAKSIEVAHKNIILSTIHDE